MTVSTTENRKEYVGDNSTVDFAFPYYFIADADLKVYLDDTLQTLTTHYTVAGAGDAGGGTITFLTAPGTGVNVIIFRDPAITQETDWVENDPDSAANKEQAADLLTMIAQRLNDLIDRSFRLSDSELEAVDVQVPTLEAEKFLRANETADGVEWFDIGDSTLQTPADDSVSTAKLTDDAVTSVKIVDSAVTLAKLADLATDKLIGRVSAGTGAPEAVSFTDIAQTICAAANAAAVRTAIDAQQDLDVPSQAEAEAGTATTERVWTAERVKQAVVALTGVEIFYADDATNSAPTSPTDLETVAVSDVASGQYVLLIGQISCYVQTGKLVYIDITDNANSSLLVGSERPSSGHASSSDQTMTMTAIAVDTAPSIGSNTYKLRGELSAAGSTIYNQRLIAIRYTP